MYLINHNKNFCISNQSIKKYISWHFKNLTLHLKKLEKEQQSSKWVDKK